MDVTSYLLGKKAGGGSKPPVLQDKEVIITENGTTNVTADAGYDGLSEVEVTTNVPTSGPDLSEYFEDTISEGSSYTPGFASVVKKIKSPLMVSGTSLNYAFNKFLGAEIPTLNATNNITSMISTFESCSNLMNIDLSNLDTSEVTSMQNIFYGCSKLTNIIVGNNWDTSNVTSTRNMFRNCSEITSIPALNTSKVKDFRNMFADCSKLTTVPVLDASSSDIANYAFSYMFNNCINLTDTSLDNILQMCISATSYTGTKTLSELRVLVNNFQTRIPALPHYQDFIDAGWTIGWN